jgi:hypothetical protein
MSALSVAVACYIKRKQQEVTDYISKRKTKQEVVEVQKSEILIGELRKSIPSEDPFNNDETYYKATEIKNGYVKYIYGGSKNNMIHSNSCKIDLYLRASEAVSKN